MVKMGRGEGRLRDWKGVTRKEAVGKEEDMRVGERKGEKEL